MSLSELVPYCIGGLVILGIVCQLTAFFGYGHEVKHIEKLKLAIEGFLAKGQREDLIKAKQLLIRESVPTKCMVANRVMEIESFAEYSGMVALHDLGAVAAEADAGKARNAIPGMLIASLLVLGLFGTLLSLRETLQDENLAAFVAKEGAASASSFQEALAPVLDGFAQAFLASICGVGGTILLIFIRVGVRNKREICFEALERLAVNQLLPYYIEPEKDVLQRAAEKLDRGSEYYNYATEMMSDSSRELQSSIGELNESSTAANKAFGEDGAVAFRLNEYIEVAKKYNGGISKVAKSTELSTSMLEKVSEKSGLLLDAMTKLGENHTTKLMRATESMAADNERLIGGLIKHTDEQNKKNIDLQNKTASILEGLNERLSLMHATVEDKDRLINELVDVAKAQYENGKQLQGQTIKSLDQVCERLQVEKLTEEEKRLLNDLPKVIIKQSSIQSQTMDVLGQVSTQLLNDLPQVITKQSTIQTQTVDLLSQVSGQLARLANKGSSRGITNQTARGKQPEHTLKQRRWWRFGKRKR
jgi:hypothetical protein